jgi:RES domain-containing protein
MRLWRISNYEDFSGQGGIRAAGRWHSKGHPIIYTAENPASALLEMMVHFDWDTMPTTYQLLTIEVETRDTIETIVPLSDWMSDHRLTRMIGDAWLKRNDALLLRVPSAIMPESFNVLINPAHPDASKLRLIKSEKVPLDPRLKKS